MKKNMQRSKTGRDAAALGAAFLALLAGSAAHAQISAGNWGSVTAPVFGSTDPHYTDAELTAGPNKFADGNYFHGVLPNGTKVLPAGTSVQIGMNPLGSALTPDGKYLITTNDDERENYFPDLDVSAHTDPGNVVAHSAYSLSVIDTATMKVVSQIDTAGKFFIGLQVTGSGPYTVYASGGPQNNVKVLPLAADGTISAPSILIPILPITPSTQGFVSNYTPTPALGAASSLPSNFSGAGAQTTFPAGSALSPDGKFLYVACNGDNSLAVISTATNTVVKQIPVGYFPYGVSVSRDGARVLVSNWGVTRYKFLPTGTPGSTGSLAYDGSGALTSLASLSPSCDPGTLDSLFFVPVTDTGGASPKTSSISVLSAPGGDGSSAVLLGSIYQGQPLDNEYQVGDTHPSAMAIVRHGALEALYVAKANDDSLGIVLVGNNRKLPDFDLSPLHLTLLDGHKVHGSYPNALAVSPDNTRLYVAEAGLNSVAVLDVVNPTAPKLLGRIPTGWYPTSLSVSPDGQSLYVTNAKGIGEDINPNTGITVNFPSPPTPATATTPALPGAFNGGVDSNYLYGSAQKISLANLTLNNTTVAEYNYKVQPPHTLDTSVVPLGGAASGKIKHVIFILHENKTFDSVLGNHKKHFGHFADTSFFYKDGTAYHVGGPVPYTSSQYTGVTLNEQLLATTFAAGVNYYSDSEESDAGHQFAASGTASDYTEKTLLVKSGRGLLVNKNFEPEDYPEGGYIFNNAARNGVSFKDYGALIRISGTDTGTSKPTTIDDPLSGNLGYPTLTDGFNVSKDAGGKVISAGDVDTATEGLGQTYFLALPILDILGTENSDGEARLDRNYPGYNFNISDQRRAKEFIKDFDAMVASNTLPQFLYIYEPNDHTGGVQAPNAAAVVTNLPAQEVADGDVGLGMVVDHLMKSKAYYNPSDGTGSAIFVTWDDAQSTLDHIHPHRTPLLVISPYAKKGYVAKKHYVTASVVKTEELLLGLPPNNYGDLFATDLRDMFTGTYNGITEADLAPKFTRNARYQGSPEGRHIWTLVARLDSSAPDRDSARLGALARLSMTADDLHTAAVRKNHLRAAQYQATQARLYQAALKLVSGPAARDTDD